MLGHFITQFSHTHNILIYFVIFLGMFVEGEAILIFAGVLIKARAINFSDTLIITFIAVIIHDMAYWYIGHMLSKTKRKKILFINLEKIEKFLEKFKQRSGAYIFVSKFAWTMNRFVLMANGYFKTALKKLLIYSIPSAFIWTITFLSLGYVFAEKTAILKKDLRIFGLAFAIFLIAIIIVENAFQKVFKKEEKNIDRI